MKLSFDELQKLFPQNTFASSTKYKAPQGVSQDTRKLKPGDMYIAIKGENFDGHDFIDAAFAAGASAALVSDNALIGDSKRRRENCFFCDDTVQGLGKLAEYYREKFTQPIIAITGSSGKTTTKEVLTHVLSQFGGVVATAGNLNNHIGVPLTIARFNDEAKFFIVEMGMNHFEEIRYLTKITKPDIGLITNVGHAHIENVGNTVEGIAQAKGELFAELTSNNTAIINNDDTHIKALPTPAKRISFAIKTAADVTADNIRFDESGTKFDLCFNNQKYAVHLQTVGFHHVQNALAVFAVCKTLNLDPQTVIKALGSFALSFNRGRLVIKNHLTLIDDTYNANPDSMRMACESAALQFANIHKIAVLGGMLELGKNARDYHKEVGAFAKQIGIDELYVFGGESLAYLEGFGYSKEQITKRHFDTQEALTQALTEMIKNTKNKMAILFKGSRGMKMENILNAIIAL